MKISHHSPSSDYNWTVRAPLLLETPAGEDVRIEAWSLAGLHWPEGAGEAPQTGVLSVPFQGVDVRFPVRLVAEDGGPLLQFEGLSGRQRETLALFYRSLLSGQMACSEDVITSLDTPVDLVPMSETEEEAAASIKSAMPAPLRIVVHVLIYLLLAATIASVLGLSLFNSFTRIDVQHGRVVAPIAQSLPAGEGFVKSISVVEGQEVVAGQVLVRLKNPVAEGKLDLARANLAQAETELAVVQDAIRSLVEVHTVERLERRVALVGQTYARFVGDRAFDTLLERWERVRHADRVAAIALDPFHFAIERLREVEAKKLARLRGLRAARDAQKDAISLSHIRAPSDGIVHQILVRKGQPYGRDDVAVVFETNDARSTEGWVSERYAETIYVGMPAQIGLNKAGERQKIAGVVTHVRAGNDPRRPGEFGIIVTVTPTEMSAAQSKQLLPRDAPVSLQTRRPWAQRVLDRLTTLRNGNV